VTDWLTWPFFEPRHRQLVAQLEAWCVDTLWQLESDDLDTHCRALVRSLGECGFLNLSIEGDARSLALARATLAYRSGLADFAFAMQGLGSGAIRLFGNEAQKGEWLPRVARGEAIAAFALTEPETGSDAANIAATARHKGGCWRLDGEKTYVSNGPIADLLTVFARTGEGEGARGISAFIVRGDDPGLTVAERIEVIAPHPLARLRLEGVRGEIIGEAGRGFRVAMQTLNLFRVTVAAAALGMAQRAFDEALGHAMRRRLGEGTLADNPVTQEKLADMATAISASGLLIAGAAWRQDQGVPDNRSAAAMAKLHATEEAQKVIDQAVQLHGGLGVTTGCIVERLYREIRALRIYEGASEVQKVVIARDLLGYRS